MSSAAESAEPLKVRDLLTILANCDPDAVVSLDIPAFIAESDNTFAGDPDGLTVDFSHSPAVSPGFLTSKEAPYETFFDEHGRTREGAKANSVSITLRDKDKNRLIAARQRAIETANEDAGMEPEPVAGDAETVIVDVPLPRSLHATIRTLLHRVNTSHQVRNEGACTHGPLTVVGLLAMLAEDAGMVESRPGSWEASHMAQVLASHGYNA
ncbi:hypothetical protein [Luteimonas sp. MHLX1A]|uniref:hypothetical protein n=1 Tax=Alterluteimonas muca TaxID=2878684 RepID=UPI001E4023EA|nr:hypothetical protein [Luteimonas sp. MHLX1A]MCD9046832.1 hypothetical protein [Luteimonas sp. MHLX1A]